MPGDGDDFPKIGVTVGDVAGCSPELLPAVLSVPPTGIQCFVFGPEELKDRLESTDTFCDDRWNWVNCGSIPASRVLSGEPAEDTGRSAYAALERAVEAVDQEVIDGLLTLPLSKSVVHDAGKEGFRGHTAYFEQHWKWRSVMTFFGESLSVALLSRHRPLDHVSKSLSTSRIVQQVKTVNQFYRNYRNPEPQFALLGLNPHAGEQGILGRQEQTLLKPALEQLKKSGVSIEGPFPADSFFPIHGERFDLVFACYHDQGLIPFKQKHFFTGVHASLGLPVLRVSPDHGIAADLAGKNQMDSRSAENAMRYLCNWLR